MLGQIDGWIALGEVKEVWRRGVLENSPCSCSAPFHECEFWSTVFDRAFGGMFEKHAERMIELGSRLHTRHILITPRTLLERRLAAAMPEYFDDLRRLYTAISQVSGSSVLIDSSKAPPYAYTLDRALHGNLRVVHLVREPRACTYSWMKRQKAQPFGRMKTIGPVANSVHWVLRNQTIRSTWSASPERYRLIRYEDLVENPEAAIRSIARMTSDTVPDLSFLRGETLSLGAGHMPAGNPNRFEVGPVKLHRDTAWANQLSIKDKAIVGVLTGLWLRKYGYT